jgi:hypothetical protein
MAYRQTNTDQTAQYVRKLVISGGTTGTLIDADTGADGTHFTLGAIWFCEETGLTSRDGVFAEWNDNSATAAHALRYISDGAGTYTIQWDCGNQSVSVPIAANPRNKWVWVFCAFERATGGGRLMHLTVVCDGITSSSLENAFSGTCVLATHLALSRVFASGGTSNRNALGIAMPFVRTDLIATGSNTVSGNATVAAASLAKVDDLFRVCSQSVNLSPPTSAGTTLRSIANWACYANPLTNGTDQRTGAALTAGVSLFDRTVSANTATAPNSAEVLAAGNNVSVLTFGGAKGGQPSRIVGSDASPATSVGTQPVPAPVGKNLEQALMAFKGATPNRQVRLGVSANSRAVWAGNNNAVRLSDLTAVSGRTLIANFVDQGLTCQANLWNNGRIVGFGNMQVPSRQTGTGSGSTEAIGGNAAEHIWGADCGSNDILCNDYTAAPDVDGTSPVASNIWTATTRLLNTSASWLWGVSRTSTTVSGSSERYRGNGNPRLVKPGYSYRILIRPENGLPVTEGLTVGFYVPNLPNMSNIKYRKVSTAGTQNGADELAASWTTISTYSAPTSLTISAHTAPTYGASDLRTAYGTFTVDDTGPILGAFVVGDVVELTDAGGVSLNDVGVIVSVSGRGTASCVITYEGHFASTVTAGSTKATFRSVASGYYRKVEVTFTASEVAAGKWRGIEIRAGGSGNGVQLNCLYFNNTTRAGIIPCHMARSGTGYYYQRMRYFRTTHATSGKSPFVEMCQIINMDAFCIMTADQGTPSNVYGSNYVSWAQDFKAGTTDLEIMFAATGPEYTNEAAQVYSEQDAGTGYPYPKTNHAAALEWAGRALNVPVVGWWYSPDQCGDVWSRQATPNDVCRDATHPTGIKDWGIWFEQLDRIAQLDREAVNTRVRRI